MSDGKAYLFTATWCGPCKVFKERVLPHLVGQIDIEEVDISDGPDSHPLSKELMITRVPSLVYFDESGKWFDIKITAAQGIINQVEGIDGRRD